MRMRHCINMFSWQAEEEEDENCTTLPIAQFPQVNPIWMQNGSMCDSTFTIHTIKWPSSTWSERFRKDKTHFNKNIYHVPCRISKYTKSNATNLNLNVFAFQRWSCAECCVVVYTRKMNSTRRNTHTRTCYTIFTNSWRSFFNLIHIRAVCQSCFTNSKHRSEYECTFLLFYPSTYSFKLYTSISNSFFLLCWMFLSKRIETKFERKKTTASIATKTFLTHNAWRFFSRNSISESQSASQPAWAQSKTNSINFISCV